MYVPDASREIVKLVPVPVVVVPPGVLISVHVPVAGKPDNITLPVARVQVGWVICPTIGAVDGGAVIITLVEVMKYSPMHWSRYKYMFLM